MLYHVFQFKNTQQYFCERSMRENGMVFQLVIKSLENCPYFLSCGWTPDSS